MERRILRLCLVLVSSAALLAGCETLEHNKRPQLSDDAKSEEDKETSAFFGKTSRPSGALSSEGRAVERSLGIP